MQAGGRPRCLRRYSADPPISGRSIASSSPGQFRGRSRQVRGWGAGGADLRPDHRWHDLALDRPHSRSDEGRGTAATTRPTRGLLERRPTPVRAGTSILGRLQTAPAQHAVCTAPPAILWRRTKVIEELAGHMDRDGLQPEGVRVGHGVVPYSVGGSGVVGLWVVGWQDAWACGWRPANYHGASEQGRRLRPSRGSRRPSLLRVS